MPTIEIHVEGPVTVVMGDADALARIERKLNEIRRQGGTIMATQEQATALLGRINAATSEIAADQSEIVERLRSIPEVPDDIVSALEAHASTLEQIAAAYPEAPAGGGEVVPEGEVPGATPLPDDGGGEAPTGDGSTSGGESGDGSEGVPA